MDLLHRHEPRPETRRPPPTASAFAFRLGFCDSPLRGKSDGSRTPWERGRPARTRLGATNLFFHKDSQDPPPGSWITSRAHPTIETVRVLRSRLSSC